MMILPRYNWVGPSRLSEEEGDVLIEVCGVEIAHCEFLERVRGATELMRCG